MAGISADDELLHAAATPDDELRAATEARAPPANEHNSSDEGVTDDHGSDDEGSYDVSPGGGAWIVLHRLPQPLDITLYGVHARKNTLC